MSFKERYSLESRVMESENIRALYSDRIPIIVVVDKSMTINKCKYLVPSNLTVGQLSFIIRKRVKLSPEQSLYMFIGNQIPPTSALISHLYKTAVDEDGFLYIHVCRENTFG